MPLRRKIGQQIADLERPRILSTDKFVEQEPQLFDLSDVFEGDELECTSSIMPDAIVPLSRHIRPRLIQTSDIALTSIVTSLPTQSELMLTTSWSRNLLDYADQRVVSRNILSEILLDAYPTKNKGVAAVDLVPPVNIIDPFAPEGCVALLPPKVVTLPPILLPFVRVTGMNYRDRIWQDMTPEYTPAQLEMLAWKKRRKSRRNKGGDANRDEIQTKTIKHKKPPTDFWEDLYLILQPPIALDGVTPEDFPHPLYGFQPRGILFLMNNNGALLADEMGTGKTVMSTVALRMLCQQGEVKKALILCPVSVLREWARHLREWAPELWVTFVRGTRRERETKWKMPTHVYVTTYSTFRNDLKRSVLPPEGEETFDAVILDEAQYIKNPKSGRSKAVKKLMAKYRWALSGTPVENKLDDLASIFDFLYPGYLEPEDLEPGRVKSKIAPYFLRRRKVDVLPDLPPKQRQDFWLTLDRQQRVAYRKVESQIQNQFDSLGHDVTKVHIFRAITRLKQICNFAPGKYTSSKMRLLKEQIEEIIENEQKVIIFTQFIGEGLLKLEKALDLYGVAKIMGGQSDQQRAAHVARFKKTSASEVPILLASVRAAGVGLNLKEATYVIHFDHWWNPAVMWQAEDRAHRADQTHGVNVYSYWIEDTIEERIYNILRQKNLLFQSVVGDMAEDQISTEITNQDWINIIMGNQIPETSPTNKTSEDTHQWSAQQLSMYEIREALLDLTPEAFERLTAELFRHLGYPEVQVTGGTADGGIDVIASRMIQTKREHVIIQCKRYEGKVGVQVARELLGVITASDLEISRGYLVTSGGLTRNCRRFCDSEEFIKAITGIELARYVKQYNLPLNGH